MSRKKVGRTAPPGGWTHKRKTIPDQLPAQEPKKRVPDVQSTQSSSFDEQIVWRFGNLDDSGRWGLSRCSESDLRDLFAKLSSFETMRVKELFTGQEHGKRYNVESISPAAQKRLIELNRDDETQIVRLRLSGKKRLFGFLKGSVFHILWWDPEHEIFPSKKRNT